MSAAGRDDDHDGHDVLDVSAVRRLRVPELRARLEARGLDSTGLKAELVDRLWAAMQADRRGAGGGKDGEHVDDGGESPEASAAGDVEATTSAKMSHYFDEIFNTAESFLYGRNGLAKDVHKGAELLKAAGHGGHAGAQNTLGVFYIDAKKGFPGDDAKAAKWFRRAADQGDAEGQWALGNCYQYGEGVDKNKVEAARLYHLSAEQGNADGQFFLGDSYFLGIGVDRDFEKAVKWYRLAVEQGHAVAQNNLGDCYENGKGVEQNYAEAARLYQLAADQDQEVAKKNLGMLYFEGNGVQRNCDTALGLLRRSGSDAEDVTDAVAEIEKGARELLEKSADTQSTMIEAGESVFGQVQDGTGDFLLHVAARTMQVDTLALLFDHASFDDLVLRTNSAGELPRDVVGTRKPLKAQSRDARALRSILSVSRRTRAACVLWCFEVLCVVAPERLMACIPRDIAREIVQRLLPSAPPGSLNCGVMALMNSPGAWPRPCLAIAPPIYPHPTSPEDARALQQQQQQEHDDLAHSVQVLGTKSDRGTKRLLEEQDDEATSGCEDDDATRSAMDGAEPANKRLRS